MKLTSHPADEDNRSATLTALYNAAVAEYQRAAWARSETLCREILKIKTDSFEALSLLGVILAQTSRREEATELLGRAVALRPEDAQAQNNYGNALASVGRHEEAAAAYLHAIASKPVFPDAHYNRGNALQTLQQWDAAVKSYDRALSQDANHAEAWFNRGNALQHSSDLQLALASYDRALSIKPLYSEALFNRANASAQLGQYDDALAGFKRLLQINPHDADAWFNRGNALQKQMQFSDAIDSYARALQCRANYPEAHVNLGRAQTQLGQWEAALGSYAAALSLRPAYADAFYNLGNALLQLRRFQDAVRSYDEVLRLNSRHAEAWNNRGNALRAMQRLDEALDSFEQALSCNPHGDWLYGTVLFARMQVCRWRDFAVSVNELTARVLRKERQAQPIITLALTEQPAVQCVAAETWTAHFHAEARRMRPVRAPHERLKIGYFSADFREHPVSTLACGVFEEHDRARFDVTAFSFGLESNDAMSRRLRAAFEKFIDVRTHSDTGIAELSRALELDIAVDLGGYTEGSRPGIFAARAAPLQVNYLGYAGTMGSGFMDYLIADSILIPPHSRTHYHEKILYLPHCALPADSRREVAEKLVARADWDLPNDGFVFCCFNSCYKITPDTFDSWLRILQRVEGSVLWLAAAHRSAMDNLRLEAHTRSIDPERLIFASRVASPAEHLARHGAADLFLDTLPYNAHATASDALWSGLPILTCLGNTLTGRVASSMLNAIELPELITSTREEFESRAVELALNPDGLSHLKAKLASKRRTAPLFDTGLYTRHLEAGFMQIHERQLAGAAPDHIETLSSLENAR